MPAATLPHSARQGRRARGRRRAGLVWAALLLGALPVGAGTLTPSNLAAAPGGGDPTGLEVNLGATCPYPNSVTVDSPPQIAGNFGACVDLVATGVEVVGPTTFRAPVIRLDNDFAVASDAAFEAHAGAVAVPFAFLVDDSPAAETTFGASWQMNLDLASIGTGDLFSVLTGASGDGVTHFEVLLKRNALLPENRLVLRARVDGGGTVDTVGTELLLPAGWNLIDIRWAAGPGNGYLVARINGAGGFNGLIGLDNDQSRIDRARFGAVSGDAGTSTGSFYLDEYASFR